MRSRNRNERANGAFGVLESWTTMVVTKTCLHGLWNDEGQWHKGVALEVFVVHLVWLVTGNHFLIGLGYHIFF